MIFAIFWLKMQTPSPALDQALDQAQAPAQARPPAGMGKASVRPSQPVGFVFDANASPEVRPGAYAGLTGPFILPWVGRDFYC